MDKAASEGEGPTAIEADAICKRFGGVLAVDDVSIAVRPGETHAIVGENGAGKSTLMRMLAGILRPDSGEIRVSGEPVRGGARHALEAGVALVHQELALVPEMTGAENIRLGAFPTRAGFVERKELRRIAADAIEEIGVDVGLDVPVRRLSVAQRQFIEIARAVAAKPKVLILDEPTATLTPAETDHLLDMLRRLAERGMAILYISHRLPEVFAICDRVTVLRDGRHVETTATSDITPEGLVDRMIGGELKRDLEITREGVEPGPTVLEARAVRAPMVNGVDLTVRAGQIVGLGGLVGAGRSETVRAILGVDPRTGGAVFIERDGKREPITTYTTAVRDGVAYVPEERRTDGLSLGLSVADNITLPDRRRLSKAGVLRRGLIQQNARELVEKVGLKPPRTDLPAGAYSGGNQQKIVLAKWLGRHPRLMVLDEPTRGVDVGAKAEIHRLIRELADAGTGVLLISSDLPELLDLSDVVHVVRDGRIAGTLEGREADEKSVMTLAAGHEAGETA